jgi:hypothetical protein
MHYRLGCDYGTALITIYKEGDPVFLCAAHATAIGRPEDNCIAGVRLVEAQPFDGNGNTLVNTCEQVQLPEPPVAKQRSRVPSKPAVSLGAAKTRRETVASSRRLVRDLTYGDSAKALVDETIWNMPTGDYEAYRTALQQGKPLAEAAQCAGGQIAIVHRKISEYAPRLEALLSCSKATISVRDVIDKPFEQAVLEIIGNVAMGDVEKDAAIDHLGEFQEQINRGLDGEITPLQAHRIARAIGDRANWGTGACAEEELRPVYRAVYASIKNAVRGAVPEALDLDERLANLCAAKFDMENAAGCGVVGKNYGTGLRPNLRQEVDSSETKALTSS